MSWTFEELFAEPMDAPEPPPRMAPRLTISALGGRPVTVDARAFESTAEAVSVAGSEFDRTTLGHLIYAAKSANNSELLAALLELRDVPTPLYRVRFDGRAWRLANLQHNQTASCE